MVGHHGRHRKYPIVSMSYTQLCIYTCQICAFATSWIVPGGEITAPTAAEEKNKRLEMQLEGGEPHKFESNMYRETCVSAASKCSIQPITKKSYTYEKRSRHRYKAQVDNNESKKGTLSGRMDLDANDVAGRDAIESDVDGDVDRFGDGSRNETVRSDCRGSDVIRIVEQETLLLFVIIGIRRKESRPVAVVIFLFGRNDQTVWIPRRRLLMNLTFLSYCVDGKRKRSRFVAEK